MDQTFNELDLTSLLSLSFSTLITELHDKLSELGFEDIMFSTWFYVQTHPS